MKILCILKENSSILKKRQNYSIFEKKTPDFQKNLRLSKENNGFFLKKTPNFQSNVQIFIENTSIP